MSTIKAGVAKNRSNADLDEKTRFSQTPPTHASLHRLTIPTHDPVLGWALQDNVA